MSSDAAMTCRAVAELGTAYLDAALPPQERERFASHCRDCESCRSDLAELRLVLGAVGRLGQHGPDPTEPSVAQAVRLFRDQGLHLERPRVRDLPLGIGRQMAAIGDHIAYLWESERDFLATTDFLITGLERGEACVLLGTDVANRRLLAGLERLGVSTSDLRRWDRLQVASPAASAESLLERMDTLIKAAVDRGLSGVRILGSLGWGEPGWPSDEELLKLEARLTNAVARYPNIVLCAYDVDRLPARTLLKGGFECHPLVLHRSTLRHNDAYVPADRFLSELAVSDHSRD